MTFKPNIPQPNDLISISQPDLLTNFSQLDTIFDQDHISYTDATVADRGKHNQSTYPDSSGDPTTAINEVALYSKDDGSGNSRLFMRQESDGTVIQMSGVDPVNATKGVSFLPGGLLIQWGKIAAPGSSGSDTFVTSFSAPPYSLTLQIQRTSANQTINVSQATPPTASGFNYVSSTGGSDFIYWMAIGPE